MWLFSLLVALPDATAYRPERLLAPTEVVIDVGAAGFFSGVTKTPSGGVERDAFTETTMRARVQVGVLRWLNASLTVPMGDLILWEQRHLNYLRVGDPTLGLQVGPAFKQVDLAAFGELTFPTLGKLTLRPAEGTLAPSVHGAVVSTGGISLVAGAFVGVHHEGEKLSFRLSARAAYRVRTNDAAHGIVGDLRLELVLVEHLLLGINASVLVPLFGLEQALISPSRTSDTAGWIDAGVRVGYRFDRYADLSAAFSAPVYTFDGGVGFTALLLASVYLGPF